MGLIAIDFDWTIVDNSKEGRPPMPGAKEAISTFREQGHKVMIFSCNNRKWIEQWMANNDIRYDYIWEGTKPACDAYIDDRAVAFRGDWTESMRDTEELLRTCDV